MSEDRVDEALRALRRADRNIETSEGAEVRALLTFRREQRRRRFRRAAMSAAIPAIAAALLLAVRAPAPQPQPAAARAAVPSPAPVPMPVSIDQPVQKIRRRQEVFTPFYPLMPSNPPFESGMLVRVTVQASALRSVGIPVAEGHLTDPVLADVLVGQDDLARAIRFVSYQ